MRLGPRLKDLGRWSSGGTPPKDRDDLWEGELPWVSAKDFEDDRLREPTTFITKEAAESHSRIASPDSILLIVRGMALAHGLPVAHTSTRVAFNQDLRALRVAPEFVPRFVYYALRGHRSRLNAHIDQAAHGTARLIDSVMAERIQASGRNTQARIADFLDRECERIDLLTDSIRGMTGQADEVARGLFDEHTAGRPRVRVRHLITAIEQGWSPDCDDREPDPQEWGVLKLGCVNSGRFSYQAKALAAGLEPRPFHTAVEGDVLMSRANTRDLVGSCAIVTSDVRPRTMFSDLLYRLTPDERKCASTFLAVALGAPSARRQIEALAVGSAGSMPKLAQGSIKQITVPDLELREQTDILRLAGDETAPLNEVCREGDQLQNCLTEYRDALITEAVTGKVDVTRLSDQQLDESVQAAIEGSHPEVLTA